MAKLEFLKVETDTGKIYKPKDSFSFKLTFNNQEPLDEDVEFEVFYFGDTYTDNHDQKLCHNIIGPLDAGKLCFELETSPIDLTKIPIKTLFGLTTILILGKFKGEQFIRIGYVVNVNYPEIEAKKLMDSDDKPLNGDEEDEEDEEYVEDESEDGDSGENEESEESDNTDNSKSQENDNSDNSDEDEIEVMDDEELDEYEKEEGGSLEESKEGENQELADALADALMPSNKREPIPLETPIVLDQDEFEFKGFSMKQSQIEMELLERPIVQVFDIEWDTGNKNEVVESSESEESGSEDDESHSVKKAKKE